MPDDKNRRKVLVGGSTTSGVVFGPYGHIGGIDGHQRFTVHVPEPGSIVQLALLSDVTETQKRIAAAVGAEDVLPVTYVCECGAGFRTRELLAAHVNVKRTEATS